MHTLIQIYPFPCIDCMDVSFSSPHFIQVFAWVAYILLVFITKSIFLQQVSDFDLFTLDDIDSAFQNVTRLTYSQNCHLSGEHFSF